MIKPSSFLKTFLAVAAVFLTAGPASSSGDASTRRIVVFSEATPKTERLSIAGAMGGRIVRTLELIDAVVVELAESEVAEAESRAKSNPAVVRIDESPRINWLKGETAALADFRLPAPAAVIPPFKRSEPGDAPPAPAPQILPWGIGRTNAPKAWSATRGQGVKVVVIDTGIDTDHADLKANLAGGWNAIAKGPDFKDDHGHGTHVAGTIAALDNDIDVVGVAPQAALYGVKVLDAEGSGTFDDVIAGMQWAVENKMQVANMSLGASRGNKSLQAAVEAMAKAGVVLVAAAGNSGGPVGYPAAYKGALAIAAMDKTDQVAYFSSRGPQVALIAPGVDVESCRLGGGVEPMSGTSMATPHAAGLAVLAIAAQGLSGVKAVGEALKAAAVPLPGVPPNQQGAGAVDAAKLVR